MAKLTLPIIPLETGWQVDYFELDPDLYEFTPDSAVIPYLSDWRCSQRFCEGWAAWLQRRFDLEAMTDRCLRYLLSIGSAPVGARFYINDALIAEFAGQPLMVDITDVVWLEDNVIGVRVECEYVGMFNGVHVRALPCI
jgi:hypothetical protein